MYLKPDPSPASEVVYNLIMFKCFDRTTEQEYHHANYEAQRVVYMHMESSSKSPCDPITGKR
jgi:hypothetical protein